jgi:hypothetical protein
MPSFSADTVCALQLPLVRDGGAAAYLHLHVPQDALPLPPNPPDRVRLYTRLFLFYKEASANIIAVYCLRVWPDVGMWE